MVILFLRDEDPISPYIFLLCADGFSSLIHDAAKNHKISGVSICKDCPKITHLFFSDDSLLFCKENNQECQNLINILQLYEATSVQKINTDKSSVFFSSNTLDERRSEVMNLLGPMQDTRHKKYLGLPSIIASQKLKSLLKLKRGWRGNCRGGRRKCCLWVAERSLLKLLLKLFQLTR